MNPIRFPAAAALVGRLDSEQPLQIRQAEHGAIITTAGPSQFCRVVTPPPPDVGLPVLGPIVIEARAFMAAAEAVGCGEGTALPGRPLVVVGISSEMSGVVGPSGTPQTIPSRNAAAADCSDTIDRVQGEAASGMTKQVAVISPEHLSRMAAVAMGMGITAVEITIAPRWDALLAEGRMSDGSEVSFGLSGILGPRTIGADREGPAGGTSDFEESDDPLTFSIPEAKPRRGGGSRKTPPPINQADLPW